MKHFAKILPALPLLFASGLWAQNYNDVDQTHDPAPQTRPRGGIVITIDLNKLFNQQPQQPTTQPPAPPPPAPVTNNPRPRQPAPAPAPKKKRTAPKPKPIVLALPELRPDDLYLTTSPTDFPDLRQFGQKLPSDYKEPIANDYLLILAGTIFTNGQMPASKAEARAQITAQLGISDAELISVTQNEPYIAKISVTDADTLETIKASPFVDEFLNDTKLYPAASGTRNTANITENWALDWFDQSSNLPDGEFIRPEARYQNPVYIIDGPVMLDHPALEDKVKLTKSFAEPYPEEDADICTMHGTAIAALITSETYGAAPQSSINAFSVLSCSAFATPGATSALILALDDIQSRHCPSSGQELCNKTGNRPIINISLTGMKNEIVNRKLKAMSDAGIIIMVAAGNEQSDACEYSPASAEGVITVASMNPMAEFSSDHSNYGSCVDIVAPGFNILVPNTLETDQSLEEYGTSLATAFVSGIVSQGFDMTNKDVDVKTQILAMGWKNVEDGSKSGAKRAVAYDLRCGIRAEDGFLNMRPTRTLASEPIAQIPVGDKLWVFGQTGEWAFVNYDGTNGWVKVKSSTGLHVVNPENSQEICQKLAISN